MFLSTLTMLARGGPPTTVHASVAAGAEWLATHAATGYPAQAIENAYATLLT
jgi:hypothetical protein